MSPSFPSKKRGKWRAMRLIKPLWPLNLGDKAWFLKELVEHLLTRVH